MRTLVIFQQRPRPKCIGQGQEVHKSEATVSELGEGYRSVPGVYRDDTSEVVRLSGEVNKAEISGSII